MGTMAVGMTKQTISGFSHPGVDSQHIFFCGGDRAKKREASSEIGRLDRSAVML